jgi:hypothetical protein
VSLNAITSTSALGGSVDHQRVAARPARSSSRPCMLSLLSTSRVTAADAVALAKQLIC